MLDELVRIAPIHAVRGNIDNERNNLGEKMMPLKEFYRYEFVGNNFECWDCKGKNDMVRCTCWFADEGDREVIRYECSDCLRDSCMSDSNRTSGQGSDILAWLKSDKSEPLVTRGEGLCLTA